MENTKMRTRQKRHIFWAALIISIAAVFVFIGLKYEDHRKTNHSLAALTEIREEIYQKIDVASNRDYLLDLLWRLPGDEILKLFSNDKGGVWCGGAAQTLATVYRERGYDAYILSCGFRGHFTHAVVLVKLGQQYYLQDPYLNYHYSMPIKKIMSDLMRHKLPEYIQGIASYRDVHLSPSNYNETWTIDPEDPNTRCVTKRDNWIICKSNHTPQLFEERYGKLHRYQRTLDKISEYGLPRDVRALIMFPYGISGADGWTNDPHSDRNERLFGRLVEYIRKISKNRINPLSIKENFKK